MLRPTVDRAELEQLIDLNVVCTVGSADTGMALNGAAGGPLHRGGGPHPDRHRHGLRRLPGRRAGEDPLGLPQPAQCGRVGHLHQLHARKKGRRGIWPPGWGSSTGWWRPSGPRALRRGVVHAAGSYALLHCADARLDGGAGGLPPCWAAAAASTATGCTGWATARWASRRPAGSPKGHTVGSARPVVLRRPTRVAVLPVGYQNGFGVARAQGSGLGALLRRWLAARRRTVRVNGQRARIPGGPSVPLRPWWTSPTSSAPPAIRRCSTSTPVRTGVCAGVPVARPPWGAGPCNKQREGNLSDARSCYQSEECLRHH